MMQSVLLVNVRRALWLALAISSSGVIAAPKVVADPGHTAAMLQGLHNDLAPAFALAPQLPIDPALRSAAEQLGAAHLAQLDRLLPRWLEEQRNRMGANANSSELYTAVLARGLNEQALWQLEPGDAEYERATLELLKSSPRSCEHEDDSRFANFSSRIMRIQAMPERQRAAMLASERQFVTHWGTQRAIAPWPDPLPHEAALAIIRPVRAGGQRSPMMPLLASELLAANKTYEELHPGTRCVLHQWWLQESLTRGATPAAALSDFRYGTLISAVDRFAGMFGTPAAAVKAPDAATPVAYPGLATRFLVEGSTIMRVQLDSAGKPRRASVEKRTITVPGVVGVRPVFFETVFDAMAIRRALASTDFGKPDSTGNVRVQYVWKFEPAKPAQAAPSQGQP